MPRPERKNQPSRPERTPIWVDGSQRPRFNFVAWALASQRMARRWIVPRLDGAAAALARFATEIAAGRYAVPLDRLGKMQRHVPSRLTVGAGVAGLAARVAEARQVLAPLLAEPAPLAYPNLVRPDFQQRPARPAPAAPLMAELVPLPRPPVSDEPALRAIRAAIREDRPQVTPQKPAMTAGDHSAPGWIGTTLARLSAHAIAWTGLSLALPVGLVQATLFHLNGGDLGDWE